MVQKRKKLKARRVRPVGRPQGRRKKTPRNELYVSIEEDLREIRRLLMSSAGRRKRKVGSSEPYRAPLPVEAHSGRRSPLNKLIGGLPDGDGKW